MRDSLKISVVTPLLMSCKHHLAFDCDTDYVTFCGIKCSDWNIVGQADLKIELKSETLCKKCKMELLK